MITIGGTSSPWGLRFVLIGVPEVHAFVPDLTSLLLRTWALKRTGLLLEWTPNDHLRHVSFVALREDKDPSCHQGRRDNDRTEGFSGRTRWPQAATSLRCNSLRVSELRLTVVIVYSRPFGCHRPGSLPQCDISGPIQSGRTQDIGLRNGSDEIIHLSQHILFIRAEYIVISVFYANNPRIGAECFECPLLLVKAF